MDMVVVLACSDFVAGAVNRGRLRGSLELKLRFGIIAFFQALKAKIEGLHVKVIKVSVESSTPSP